ncbi:MAG TPA: hypothetical protein VKB14_11335 [Actinomycetales bacterium]|nr:hypothetical protein [Actinomycetales bacterium]
MKTPSRRSLAGVVTAGALLAASGCSMFSGTQVLEPVQLSDGVSATVGDVEAQALVLVGQKGQPGVLTGALVNQGTQPVTVTVAAQGSTAPTPIQVPAGSSVSLGSSGGGASVVIPTVAAEAGAMTDVQLSTPSGGQVRVQVPVLPTSYPYYSTVTPPTTSGGSATTAPGVTSSPTATDTDQPTTSPS